MHGTREQVLQFLIQRDESRIEELSAAFAITPVAMRRHLENLRADGLVDARAVKQATGRPYYAYHATDQARGVISHEYADLLERVLRSVEDHDEVTEGVARHMAESVARRHRSEMDADGGPEERIVRVTESLRQEGILDGWRTEEDGFHLVNGACPYRKAAEISKLPCESDRKAIEMLLGQDVEQLQRIVDGAAVCEYLVQAMPGQGAKTEEKQATR
ncbi:MAG: helix-turn-helix transcriptional regulator [Dehalococcoidia bacterium]